MIHLGYILGPLSGSSSPLGVLIEPAKVKPNYRIKASLYINLYFVNL